jgi:hypothetical protein
MAGRLEYKLDRLRRSVKLLTSHLCCLHVCVQVLVQTPQRNYTIADLSSLFTAIGDTQSVSNAALHLLASAVQVLRGTAVHSSTSLVHCYTYRPRVICMFGRCMR